MRTSKWRGHTICCDEKDQFFFIDTGEPTVGSNRPCGRCGEHATDNDHDACLGTLPGVTNACCGHGEDSEAYVQFKNGEHVVGVRAVKIMKRLVEENGK